MGVTFLPDYLEYSNDLLTSQTGRLQNGQCQTLIHINFNISFQWNTLVGVLPFQNIKCLNYSLGDYMHVLSLINDTPKYLLDHYQRSFDSGI